MAGREYGASALSPVREHPAAVAFSLAGLVVLWDLFRRLTGGSLRLSDLATFLWDGTILGMGLGLAGIGLAMTYSILNFANFAHGDLVTSGAVAGWITTFLLAGFGEFATQALLFLGGPVPIDTGRLGISATNTPVAVFVGLLVSVTVTAGLALSIDRFVFRPLRDESGISLLIASVGVALILRYLMVFGLQAGTRGLTDTGATPGLGVAVGAGELSVSAHEVTLVVFAGAMMLGTHLLLRHTKLGTAMRAMADNEDLARVSGIPTERVIRATWVLGGAMAGAAGFLIALERGTVSTTLGWDLLLLVFAAVILGGIGSVYGAMVGGLVVGITSRLSLVWLPESFILVAAFLVMITMLLTRPQGLLGGVTTV